MYVSQINSISRVSHRRSMTAIGLTVQQFREEMKPLKEEVRKHKLLDEVQIDAHTGKRSVASGYCVCKYEGCSFVGQPSRIAEHILAEHLGRRPQCHACKTKYVRLDILRKHRNHDDKSEKGSCIVCRVCKMACASGKERVLHEANCTGDCAKEEEEPVEEKDEDITTIPPRFLSVFRLDKHEGSPPSTDTI